MRIRGYDYRRDAFGDTWTDDNPAPGGHNGCDTRNDILDRDLVDKTYVSIKRCPNAVATGTLHDPYTNATIAFVRGEKTGAAVQIDHIVPLAFAWDLGARNWTDEMRVRFANDPANLLAIGGQVNQDKSDKEPAVWMPPNTRSSASTRCSSSRCCAATACRSTRRRPRSCAKRPRRALRAEPVFARSAAAIRRFSCKDPSIVAYTTQSA